MNRFLSATATMLACGSSGAALAQATAQPPAQPAAPVVAQAGVDPAASTNQDSAAGSTGDVVVTAQKREQRLVDVPVTITALTGQRLAELGVNSLSEAALYVPGLRIQEQSDNNPGFVIRGVTSDSGSAQQGARVTLYYNGVDISRSRGAYQDIYDVERIEVVKGPQATLFGTAAEVGAVSIISAPARAGTAAAIDGSYGNYNRAQVSGYLNVGTDTLAARLAFAYKRHGGYVRNVAGDPGVPNQNQGRIDQDDLYAQDQRGVRGTLAWRPTDRVNVALVGTWDSQRNSGTPFRSRVFAPTGGNAGDYSYAELSGSPNSAQVLGAAKLGLKRDVFDGNVTVNVDLGHGATFTSVTGYRHFNALEVFDADGGPAWYLEFAEDARGDQWSHEDRFAFTGEHYRASFGVNGFFENGVQRVPFSTEEGTYLDCSVSASFAPIRAALAGAGLPTGTACVTANGTIPATRATAILSRGALTQLPYASSFSNYGTNDTYSVFADGTYIATPRLELTAGARVLIEQRKSGYATYQPNSVLLAGLGVRSSLLGIVNTNNRVFTATRSFQAILPRFNALFRVVDGINLYATISKGRRSPVVQLTAANAGTAAAPVPTGALQVVPDEILWNYEAGVKVSTGGLTGTLSAFYQTYNGFQVSVMNANGTTTTASAGAAHNPGVELDATYRLARALSVFGSFGFLGGGIDSNAANGVYAGNRFRLQPKYTASMGATLRLPLAPSMTLYATPSATYQSKEYFELPNLEAISQGSFTLVNVRAGVELDGGRYRIGGFARNLTNKRYLLDAGNTGGGFGDPTYIAGEPRFYGIEVGAKF